MNKYIEGKYINLRDVREEDAEFILSLRTSEKKSQFLHKTQYDLGKQVEYIKHYKTLDNEWYFIIEDKRHVSLGTVRIYDIVGDSFCWGSWLLIDGLSPVIALESALLIYEYAFYSLKFSNVHFDVRKGNVKVQRFHESFGAQRVGETDLDIFYTYTKSDYEKIKDKFFKMAK